MMGDSMPEVTVLLPVYNSRKHLREAIESVIHQTFTDWEMLIINEYGSDDGSLEIIKEYLDTDNRVCLIQNETKLGLAESLNKGMNLARGEYIARMDADDLAHPDRLVKQVKYMQDHPLVSVCGTYQHHFGVSANWIHKPPITPQQCKTNLIFFCDLCHSTLMLRKGWFIQNNLYYDNSYYAEDFELWTRVIKNGEIANIPEVLGEYRWGEDNISIEKKQYLQEESGKIVAKVLKDTLGLTIPDSYTWYFNNWSNPFYDISDQGERTKAYQEFQDLLKKIYHVNQEKHFFDEQSLLNTIGAKWKWARYGYPFNRIITEKSIESIFQYKPRQAILTRFYYFWVRNKGVRAKWSKICGKMSSRLLKK